MVIHQHHDILLFHPTEKTLEIAPALEGRAQLNFYLITDMGHVLFNGEQGPIHTGRRNLKGVVHADRIFHIEHATQLTTHLLAIVDENAVGMIDIDSQQ